MNKTPLKSHLKELRNRLLIAFTAYLTAVCICFSYADVLNQLLLIPLFKTISADDLPRKLIFTGLTEGFNNHIHVAMYAGFCLAFPVIAWEIYFFIAPAFYRSERIALLTVLFFSPLLFALGATLAYFYVMPAAWKFFLTFERQGVIPIVFEARISEYVNLASELIVGFGLAFQLPLIMASLVWLKIIDCSTLRKSRRYTIVIIFILAALLTPPDVFSQIALAIPLLLLYEISLLICQMLEKKSKYHARY
jgi:sec-independent protein translocase protein TatC